MMNNQMKMESTFILGQKFASFQELRAVVQRYEKENFTRFWIRDCRTIKAARRTIKKDIDEGLKYYELCYACVRGGKKHSASPNCVQRTSRNVKKDCPVSLKLRASSDGQSLQVRYFMGEHNHPTSPAHFNNTPQQRKLKDEELKITQKLLEHNPDKMVVQSHVQKLLRGNQINLRDVRSQMARSKISQKADFQTCVKQLQEKYGAFCDVLTDEDSQTPKGLFFQTELMKRSMAAYPEFLMIDGICDPLDFGAPVFLLVQDANGKNRIVCVAILVSKDATTFSWFLETFRENNPSSIKMKCIMGDKEVVEHDLLKSFFPGIPVLISVSDTLKTFEQELNADNLNISLHERLQSLEILEELLNTKSMEEFEETARKLEFNVPDCVYEYFNKNWCHNRDEWWPGGGFGMIDFLNSAYNQTELLNVKLRQNISKCSSLKDFIDNLFNVLTMMQTNRNFKVIGLMQKQPRNSYAPDSTEERYTTLLTQYAGKLVLKQLEDSQKVTTIEKAGDLHNFYTREGLVQTTPDNCTCKFRVWMLLPCSHILAVRQLEEIDPFAISLCHERWTNEYYISAHNISDDVQDTEPSFPTVQTPKSNGEKKMIFFRIVEQLESSIVSSSNFDKKIELLQKVSRTWAEGKEIADILPE